MKLPRSRRITSSSDFRLVRQVGRSAGGRAMVLAVAKAPDGGETRFGFVTSKRIGNAVVRNRVRRRLRAAVREEGEQVASGLLVVTIARSGAGSAPYPRLRSEWIWLARKLGLSPRGTGAGEDQRG